MNLTASGSTTSLIPSQTSLSQSPLGSKPRQRTKSGTANQMRVAIYIRVSDQSQVDSFSLDAQERQCIEYCKSKDHVPVRVYREEGRSARFESIRKRPEFRQLLEDAARGLFDLLLVHSLDRFSRNMKVMLESLSLLEGHNVGLASVTEDLDWSTAEGRLVARTLGSFSEFFSDMLAKHTKKGIDERARQGMHLGAIPFGYESCWKEGNGERVLTCKPEHPGGVHVHHIEGDAVRELFTRYATGTATLASLALWLNDEGFRTRNRHRLDNGQGGQKAEPRLFTTASVRGILHNPFFIGRVRHRDRLYPGLHDPLVSEDLFQVVQFATKKNSGRSETLSPRPQREYLLKGIIRCAYCLMPMWAQTYNSGNTYYREHKGSRGAGACVNSSGSMRCHIPDDQMGQIIGAITLPESWMDRVLARIQLADEVAKVDRERKKLEQRLKRLGQVYLDELMDYEDYRRQKRQLEDRLSDLVIPGAEAAQQAGRLLESLPDLWEKAELPERRRILMTMLDAVYVECREEKQIVAIKPKPAFRPLFEVVTTREGSGIVLISGDSPSNGGESTGKSKTPPSHNEGVPEIPCFWWRRGRVDLPLKRGIQILLAA